jgi:hypothetical protein
METPNGYGGFLIFGCGHFGFEDNYEAAVEAFYENGDWYFSTVSAVFSAMDVPPNGCWHKKK